jgi:glycosyltransferase involved in cell wall biosynthesis
VLTVSRLVSYKNVDAIIAAALASDRRLVVVGEGPDRRRLERQARGRVVFLGNVSDGELLWLYQNASCLATASHEDFGLVPLEANAFGLPVLALRWGGFLDTIVEGETGLFFDQPVPRAIADGLEEIERRCWDVGRLQAHARRFSEESFISRLRAIVESQGRAEEPSAVLAAVGGIGGRALR